MDSVKAVLDDILFVSVQCAGTSHVRSHINNGL